ncbi:efflux RND transporter permease subunit [Persicimonas caeni]|uniref:Efflux RND transporter permease subunit n=1 Tax=Persicimonas caeni TaxID=2292766 RepID=A0A4Y6PV59_PERCE|nr:efflux RND transporter permease subunit [Persicimonas caeni]QDG52212.1 efflux RND transporter permease subunit [Persicimonas caeni]QED33434.1 efflux RND transporter permease subunit [Persicimonas caeni]
MSSPNSQPDAGAGEQRGPIAWMAKNPIAANLLMFLLLFGGLWTTTFIQKEVEPRYQLDVVEVSVTYPGAAPAEVETGILLPIEEAVRGVKGIKEISSTAWEGSGRVSIELVSGADRMVAFQDIDQAVSRIRTFPDDTEEPEVRLQAQEREVMQIGLYGEVDPWTLRKLGERLRDRLLSNPAITQVDLGRVPEYVTHVEIPASRLREYDLTLGEVADIIEESSQDVPAGDVQTSAGEILLRMKERKQWAEEFATIPIVTSASGTVVTLGNLADITDGFEEIGFHSKFNAQPSVSVAVYRIGDQSPLDISEAVRGVMDDFETSLPIGVEMRVDSSSADDYNDRLALLLENAFLAVIIVLTILALFLELRLAFWVMMGMTISFVGAILFLPMADVSINMISMFGFLVALGIVVDDAIVVGENIHEYREKGGDRLTAAIQATRDIARPVTFTILTTVVAFVPLLFIPGTTGKYWWPLPAVVITVLLVSLVEALFILPAHLGHKSRWEGSRLEEWLNAKQHTFARWFNKAVEDYFGPLLDKVLKYRYVTVTAALGLLAVVGGYGYSGHMGMVMMPEVAADEIEAGARLPVGTTPKQAAKTANEITASTQRMFEEHDLYRVAHGVKTNVRGGNFIDVEIVMRPPDERDMTANDVIKLWRDEIGDIAGVDQISFEAERGPGGWRQDIEVDLSHNDVDTLEKAAMAFKDRLDSFDASRDVTDNYNRGKTQFDLKLLPEGRALGLTPAVVGQQVRDAFFGALAMRQLRGTNEIEVRVKLPKEEREDLYFFQDFVVRTPDGTEVPLLDVAEVSRTEAFTSINRRDGRRVVTVSTDVEPKSAVTRVIESLQAEELPAIRADYPGLTWSFEGTQAEMRESTKALWGGFALAMLVVYSLLAVAFRSYVQPFIVLAAIPFGVIGAVIGHILLGYDLSLMSLMGIIALSGVVVNDSLIMIDYANKKRAHTSAFDAIHQAGIRRFRPILLTTLTTFGGLAPIILETSNQAKHLIPMAISLGFGIVFATSLLLLLVPSLYMILEDVMELLER